MRELKEILIKGAQELGIVLTTQVVEDYILYAEELKKWNQKINLTALKGDLQIGVKHFLDSLTVVPYLRGVKRVLDIGSGAGFPGLPLKILFPSIELLLLESSQKKAFFLRHMVRRLGLEGAKVIHGRAQQGEIINKYSGNFDLVLSRALADLPTFLLLALPYVKQGGLILGMRGKRGEQELHEVDWKGLGLKLVEKRRLVLPFLQETRILLLFQFPENPTFVSYRKP